MAGPAALPRDFGAYRLDKVLGTGAITTAYLATDRGSGERVVLKQIHKYLLEQQEEVDLFVSEAQVLAALDHPNIGRILDVGLVEEVPFLSLEFISGRDLTEVLLKRESMEKRPLPLPLCLYVGRAVAEALSHAHTRADEQGRGLHIVHRDVSPNNVILCFDGGVKLVDFGIARSSLRATRTTVGMIRGTPGYMSPEQLRADLVDGRSDVFVLGALLYRMIAGKPPFPVEAGNIDSYRRPLTDEAAPLHLVRPEVPQSLSVLVAQAMKKDIIERTESAEAFSHGLAEVARLSGGIATPPQVADLLAWIFPEAAELDRQQSEEADAPAPLEEGEALTYVRDDPGVALPDFGDADSTESTQASRAPVFSFPEVTDPGLAGGDTEEEEDPSDDTFLDRIPAEIFIPTGPPTVDAPPPQMTPMPRPVDVVHFEAQLAARNGVTTARRGGVDESEKRRSLFGAIGIVFGLVALAVLAGYLF